MKDLDYLINELIMEDKRLSNVVIPDSLEEKKYLYRSLRNIREAKPISLDYLKVQDKYLKEEINKRGIIDHESILMDKDIISIWQGDITTLKVDAIVNACNPYLLGCFIPNHNCIDNVIHSFSGMQLREECNNIMKGGTLKNGEVVLTHGYNLPSKYIIHTVGPQVGRNLEEKDREELKSCYKNSLELAKEKGIKSIAFPCISTGVYGFPKNEACLIAVSSVEEYLEDNSKYFDHIIFNVFTDEDLEIYKRNLV